MSDTERWRGECMDCGSVVERGDEAEVQRTMRNHAEQLDHVVSVDRITDDSERMTWLACPVCHRRFFSMEYDEATDELIFTCRDCGSDYPFRQIKTRISRLVDTGSDQS